MTFRQNFFLQDWFRNKLGVGLGLELVFGIGLVKPLFCYVLSLGGKQNKLFLVWEGSLCE
jgi:hypothetical protein